MFFAEYLFGRSERHTHTYTCNNETERKTMKKTKAENGYSVTEKVELQYMIFGKSDTARNEKKS